jgi:hypothetical protein
MLNSALRNFFVSVPLVIFLSGQVKAYPVDDLQPGEWYEVPNSKIRDVLPDPVPPGDAKSITGAWNSGAYDTKRDRYIVFGGGHADYGGNEIYAFDIHTLRWSRIWGPSLDIPPESTTPCKEAYSDGNPASRHTYDGLEYLPNVDKFWIHGGSLWCATGGSSVGTWLFDFTRLKWTRSTDYAKSKLEMVSEYDPVTGNVYVNGPSSGNKLQVYNPITETWSERGDLNIGYGQTATIDLKHRMFVSIGKGSVRAFPLDGSQTLARQELSTSGATELVSLRYPGIAYDPVSEKVVGWHGGPSVYSLDLDTLVWRKYTTGGSVAPPQAARNGTFGRWRYIPSKNVFIVVNGIDQNVYIYKHDDTKFPADTNSPSSPTDLEVF